MHGIRRLEEIDKFTMKLPLFDVETRIGGEGRERCINFQPNEVFSRDEYTCVCVCTCGHVSRVINDQEVAISLFNPTT